MVTLGEAEANAKLAARRAQDSAEQARLEAEEAAQRWQEAVAVERREREAVERRAGYEVGALVLRHLRAACGTVPLETPLCGVTWRAQAWRGVAWRDGAWGGVAWHVGHAMPCHATSSSAVPCRNTAGHGWARLGLVTGCGSVRLLLAPFHDLSPRILKCYDG